MLSSIKKHICFAVSAALFTFLLAGCQNVANPPDSPQTAGHTGIWLEIGGQGREGGARTAIPELAGLYYSLLFTPEDGDAVFLDLSGDTALRVELEPGTWRVDVRAFLTEAAMADINNAIAAGSVTGIQVTEGHITLLNVALGPVDSGNGSLGYTVRFPSEVSEARLVITSLVSGTKQIIDLLSGATGDTVKAASGAVDPIAAGYYRMDITLTIPDMEFIAGKRAGVSEVVHIYPDTATPVAHTFTAGNFAGSATLIFDSLADFSAYMTGAQANSAATPYNVVLDGINVAAFSSVGAIYSIDPLYNLFNAFNGKYVALDLSSCTGTSIAGIAVNTDSIIAARPDKDKLVSVILPATLQSIGNYVFYNHADLAAVDLPDSLQTINGGAFYGCAGLVSVDLPDGLQTIGDSAFYGTNIVSVSLPDGLQAILNPFPNCTNLVSLELPASPLWNVNNITTALPRGTSPNLAITVRGEGTLSVTADKKSLLKDTEMVYTSASGEISIPEGVTALGFNLFNGNKAVTKITLPASLTSLGDYVFRGTTNLAAIDFSACALLTSLDSLYCFYDTPALTSLDLSGCTAMTVVGDPNSINYFFQGCGISSFTLPPNLETLWVVPPRITSFTVPSTLKTPGGFGSNTLTTVDFTTAVALTQITSGGFNSCTNLETLTNFENCTALEEIGQGAFSGTKLASITWPAGVTVIPTNAFAGCTSLVSVGLHAGITSIGQGAFSGTNLSSIDLTSLTELTSISCFKSCTNLASVALPVGITSIGYEAFSGCTSLTSIDLPTGVTSIGSAAFANCPITVTVRAIDPPTLVASSFTDATLVGILVPAESVDTYKAATGWSTFAAKISAIP
jgi:hypothetical protein